MKKLLFALIALTIISCKSQDLTDRFVKAYQKLPLIKLPITMRSFNKVCFDPPQQHVEDAESKAFFGHGWGVPIGRLNSASNFYLVLSFLPDDVGIPIITSYKINGSQIDSLKIFNERAAVTIGLISKQTAILGENNDVEFIDSSSYLDENEKITGMEIIKNDFILMKKDT